MHSSLLPPLPLSLLVSFIASSNRFSSFCHFLQYFLSLIPLLVSFVSSPPFINYFLLYSYFSLFPLVVSFIFFLFPFLSFFISFLVSFSCALISFILFLSLFPLFPLSPSLHYYTFSCRLNISSIFFLLVLFAVSSSLFPHILDKYSGIFLSFPPFSFFLASFVICSLLCPLFVFSCFLSLFLLLAFLICFLSPFLCPYFLISCFLHLGDIVGLWQRNVRMRSKLSVEHVLFCGFVVLLMTWSCVTP